MRTSTSNDRFRLRASHVGLALSLVACAGSQTQAPPPEPATLAQSSSTIPQVEAPLASSPPTTGDAAAGAQSVAKPEEQSTLASASTLPTPPEPSEPTQSPVAILTRPAVAFQIDHEASAPRQKAEAACSAETKQDAQTASACLQKARDRFLPDVLRFRKGKEGKWLFTVYKSSGSELREIYVATVELADDSPTTVRLKVIGREQGQRPLFKGRASPVLTVPNDYSLEIDDPQLGKLLYGAKVGVGD